MDPASTPYPYLAILLLLGVSALFSLVKVVFTNLYTHYDENAHRGTHFETIHQLFEGEGFSETITQGRILANLAAGILLFQQLNLLLGEFTPWRLIDQTLVLLADWALLYTLSIFIPSVIGNLRPTTLSLPCLVVFRIVRLPVMGPARLANRIYLRVLDLLGYDPKFGFLTEAQRDALQADASEDDAGLEEEERQMILNIFDFVETPVREIMTPRVDMCALDLDTPLSEVIEALNSERHSRLPVYRDTIDNVIGILSNRDFLEWYTEHRDETFDLSRLVMPAFFVPYHKKIDELLRELRKSGNQLAIVVDEYGGTAGLVTVEDILEEIVGDIKDEDDEDEPAAFRREPDGSYLLDPHITLGDLEYELDVSLQPPEGSHVETLSGLIQATLGTLPEEGTELSIQDVRFKILKVDGTRMEEVRMVLPEKR